jgi:putative heme-binding domain-containing protein
VTGIPIITFGQSATGEPLVVSYDGSIYRLVRNPLGDRSDSFPTKLSETGLFESIEASSEHLSPAPGVYRYEIAAESFRDGVSKRYHVAIPQDQSIKVAKQKRQWKYPVGTVFARTFSKRDGESGLPVRIETQLIHYDGLSWQPYSYLWNESQTDAHLLDANGGSYPLKRYGMDPIEGQSQAWHVHSRSQCRSCHTNQAGGAVGFSLENLSDANIARFVEIGVLDQSGPEWWAIGKMVRSSDDRADLDARARSYLAANCAHCHRRGGGGSVPLDLEYSNPIEKINAVGVPPMQGSFEIQDAKVIAPGDPFRSVLLYRMATTGVGRMPKLSHHDPDPAGLLLVHDWIRSLQQYRERGPQSRTSLALKKLTDVLVSGPKEVAIDAARSARDRGDVLTEGLFERFLPASERRDQLGPEIDPAKILAIDGDATRGRKWLTESRGAQCIACHRVDGRGQNVGPGFDGIGSTRTPAELLESILKPSAKIDAKYQTQTILTDSGSVVVGLSVEETLSGVTIRTADGKDHVIPAQAIEARRAQQQSLMPNGLAESMTARELADLLAYLCSLRSC